MTIDESARLELSQSIRGQLVWPDDEDFDLARAVYNGVIDRRPAVIVRPLDAADAAVALEFARSADLPVSVRGGGHSVAGHAVGEGAVMLDLRLLREVRVDAASRRVAAGGGCTWTDFDPPCQRHGLATPGGTFATTGIGGLTLGGGIGHLIGPFGLTLDNLLEAELVTANGRVVVAREDENADLFWALRGAGGNFGVVTRFVYRLHEVGSLEGGLLVYDFARARDVICLFRDVMATAPDELTLFLVLGGNRMTGSTVVVVSACLLAPTREGRRGLTRLREARGLVADGVRPTSYLQLQGLFGEVPFGRRQYWKGHFVDALSDELVDGIVQHFAARPSPAASVLVEPLHGAARRVPADATAFAHRSATFNVTGISTWESPADDADEIAWVRAFADALAAYSSAGGGYVNYMSGDEPPSRVEAAFGPERFARLRAVKRTYDPENRFRFNANIPPAE